MTVITIEKRTDVTGDNGLISGTITLSNGCRVGYMAAKDGELSGFLERAEGGFMEDMHGWYRTSDPVEMVKKICERMEWLYVDKGDTFEQWDAKRRAEFDVFDAAYDNVEVVHNEYETGVYYGASGGRVVANWNTGVGEGTVGTVEQFANDIANDTRNYIRNAAGIV